MATDATDLKHCNNSFKDSKTNHDKQGFSACLSEPNSNTKFVGVGRMHVFLKAEDLFFSENSISIFYGHTYQYTFIIFIIVFLNINCDQALEKKKYA